MKLGELLRAREGIRYAYTLKLKSGARALKLRKVLVDLDGELKNFDAIKDEYIKATGKESLSQEDPEFKEIVARIDEAAREEIETKVEAVIEMIDLENVEASAQDIDAMLQLGLVNLETKTP